VPGICRRLRRHQDLEHRRGDDDVVGSDRHLTGTVHIEHAQPAPATGPPEGVGHGRT
jgi:hypothetical protein